MCTGKVDKKDQAFSLGLFLEVDLWTSLFYSTSRFEFSRYTG